MSNKAIDKDYLLTQLKNFDSKILSETYLNQANIWEGTSEELEAQQSSIPKDSLLLVNNDGMGGVVLDAELSNTSENAIQNKAVSIAIDELKNSVSDGKKLVADAITDKGVTTAEDATFATMATNISTINSASGNATEAEVLAGKTFSNDNEIGLTGTMPNNGAVTPAKIDCGGSYTIPAGYHNGSGKVEANTLASQTSVDTGKSAVTSDTMLTGSQGYVNGSKITGTMPNNGSVSQTLAANGTYTIPAGYHDGTGKVSQSLTTQAAKTYSLSTSDQTIAAGTYLSGAATIKGVSSGTLTLSNTTSGTDCTSYSKVATSGLVKPTATKAATTYRASTSAQTIAAGTYCSGAQTIAAVSQSNLAAGNIRKGVTISVSNGASNIWSVAGTYVPPQYTVQNWDGNITAKTAQVTVTVAGTYFIYAQADTCGPNDTFIYTFPRVYVGSTLVISTDYSFNSGTAYIAANTVLKVVSTVACKGVYVTAIRLY